MAVNLSTIGESLPGENREFGGNAFYIDLIPGPSHFISLRTCLAAPDWKAISQYVIQRAGRKCEICGSEEKLEAHERWRVDPEAQKQSVARLLCVCKKCHLGIHYALVRIIGMKKEIDTHIMAVTGWNEETLSSHVQARSETFRQLSKHKYEVDLSMFEKIGIVPRTPDDRAKRITAARVNAEIFDNTKEGQAAMEKYVERQFAKAMMKQPVRQQSKKS